MEIHKVKEHPCPVCKETLDAVGYLGANVDVVNPDAAMPRPEDITICCGCQTVLVFTDDMQVRVATLEEMREWPSELKELMSAAILKAMKGELGVAGTSK